MIKRTVDERDGIIFVTGTGIWTRTDVDDHYAALRQLIDHMRRDGRLVRVLSDITKAVRQSSEIEIHIREHIDRTYRPGDRVAILVADADDKMYVRGLLGHADVAAFSSQITAEIWLMEPALKRPA
jgi:hypothetical protein